MQALLVFYSKFSKLISFEKFNNFTLLNPINVVSIITQYCSTHFFNILIFFVHVLCNLVFINNYRKHAFTAIFRSVFFLILYKGLHHFLKKDQSAILTMHKLYIIDNQTVHLGCQHTDLYSQLIHDLCFKYVYFF